MDEFDKLIAGIDPVEKEFVELSMLLSSRARALLMKSSLKNQKNLAKKLGKNESEVSRWLNNMHNITLYNIARLNVALGERIFEIEKPIVSSSVVTLDNSKETVNSPITTVSEYRIRYSQSISLEEIGRNRLYARRNKLKPARKSGQSVSLKGSQWKATELKHIITL